MDPSRRVLIFGAAGNVGSIAALEAHRNGAEVILAMRDSSKFVPKLADLDVLRVQADLTKPETIRNAIDLSKATIAFVYPIYGIPDAMRGAFVALKESGIESVVLLSSFTVQGDPHDITTTEIVPYLHAQVEISLFDVFGSHASAVRPAYFASNTLQYKKEILDEEVRLPNPEAEFDWISPEDIGCVIGIILAKGTQDGYVPLVGPNQLSLRDILNLIGDTMGKKFQIAHLEKEKAIEDMQQRGVAEKIAQWYVETVTGKQDFIWGAQDLAAGLGNVQKYTGRSPMEIGQWLKENKGKFAD